MSEIKNISLKKSWETLVKSSFSGQDLQEIRNFIEEQKKQGKSCYPPDNLIFKALDYCDPREVKVLILGQDPYHHPGQANGLAFSVNPGIKLPPSLKNIFKELQDDMGITIPKDGSLESWAKQGVLLLNAVLTVNAYEPTSHAAAGWEKLSDSILAELSKTRENLVFILWGSYAQKKAKLLDENKHLILQSAHPSPLSSYRGFFGSKPFSKTNAYLKEHGIAAINWSI